MIMDDNDGQMIFGDLRGLKHPDICLTGEEKPREKLTQETCRTRARCVTGAHAAACPTAVDSKFRQSSRCNVTVPFKMIGLISNGYISAPMNHVLILHISKDRNSQSSFQNGWPGFKWL